MRPKTWIQSSCHMGLFNSQPWAPLQPANWIDWWIWLLVRRGVGARMGVSTQTHPHCLNTLCGTLPQEQGSLILTEYRAQPTPITVPLPEHRSKGCHLFSSLLSGSYLLMLASCAAPFPFCSLTFLKNWCKASSTICTDFKFPDPTISSKTGLVSSPIIISDSPKEIT